MSLLAVYTAVWDHLASPTLSQIDRIGADDTRFQINVWQVVKVFVLLLVCCLRSMAAFCTGSMRRALRALPQALCSKLCSHQTHLLAG